jgi:hypothetical protein
VLVLGPPLAAAAFGAVLPGGWPSLAAAAAGAITVAFAYQAIGLAAILLPLGYGAAAAGFATWGLRFVAPATPRLVAALASAVLGGGLSLTILFAALGGA